MKNLTKYFALSLVAGLTLSACNDLDTEPWGDVITEDQNADVVAKDPSMLEATISGLYANINAWESAYEDMFDFGYPAIMIQLESRTEDFVTIDPGAYGWFANCVAFTDNTSTSPYNTCRWRVPYNVIYASNNVVALVDKEATDNTLRFYRGQALGTRAFGYWILAQLYQFNYVGHQQDPCVPLITDENQQDAVINGAPRATVEEIYTQIINDLTEGITLMDGNPMTRPDKRYIDINVLRALRARTYLCMQKYAEAAADAQAVINSGRFTPLSADQAALPGFITLSDANWVWGINISEEDVHGLYTFAGMMGSYTYGYAYAGMWKCINQNLFARIPSGDVRRGWWIDPDGNSNASIYMPDGQATEYLESVGAPTYAVTKFRPYGDVLSQSNNPADVPLIRIEEMYLILAEAQGLGENISTGKATLEKFVNDYRWKGNVAYTCAATTTEEFINEIWFQRRIELWGEGLNYFDVMRLKKPIDRSNSNFNNANNNAQYAYKIPAESAVMLSLIPQSEINGNPAITDADQNPTGQASL